MAKFVNSNGDEINADVVLWSGSHKGYSHEITLNDDALKFKEMICIVNTKAVIFPIIDGEIVVSAGMVESYKVMACSLEKYDQSTHFVRIGTCIWTNVSNNEGGGQLLQKSLEDISHR